MAWGIDDIPDQSGRVFFITGANTGLGFATALALFNKGAKVLMGCRSKQKAENACKLICDQNTLLSPSNLEIVEIDLSDLNNVNNAAKYILKRFERLDVLINNAGIMAPPKTLSAQGLEIQFAVNHLSHMALSQKLIPLISETDNARIVTVTSGVQYFAKVNFSDLQGQKRYDRWSSYAQSKLLNVMFALELDCKLKAFKNNIISLLAHPGLARTELQYKSLSTNYSWQESIAYKLLDPFFQSPNMGALPQLLAATSLTAKGSEQYGPRLNFRGYPTLCRIAPLALNKKQRRKIWDISEELISNYLK